MQAQAKTYKLAEVKQDCIAYIEKAKFSHEQGVTACNCYINDKMGGQVGDMNLQFTKNDEAQIIGKYLDYALASNLDVGSISQNNFQRLEDERNTIYASLSQADNDYFSGLYARNNHDELYKAYQKDGRRGDWLRVEDQVTGKRTITTDPERAPLVKRLFEEYATGTHSIRDLTRMAKTWGLTNRTKMKNPLCNSQMFNLIQNSFYYGVMKVNGLLYQHVYEPIISYDTYMRYQQVREGWHKKPFNYSKKPYLLRGLIHCSKCGCTLSPETKKGKYTYLRPTRSHGPCDCTMVREELFLDVVKDVLKNITFPKEFASTLSSNLKASLNSKKLYQQQTIDNLQTDLTITQNRIDTLLDMRIDMQITRDEYDRKNQELMIKQNNTAQMIKSHMDADAQFRFVVNAMICLCEDALGTFERSELDEQRKLMTLVFSELQISKDKPQISLRKPFDATCPSIPAIFAFINYSDISICLMSG